MKEKTEGKFKRGRGKVQKAEEENESRYLAENVFVRTD